MGRFLDRLSTGLLTATNLPPLDRAVGLRDPWAANTQLITLLGRISKGARARKKAQSVEIKALLSSEKALHRTHHAQPISGPGFAESQERNQRELAG